MKLYEQPHKTEQELRDEWVKLGQEHAKSKDRFEAAKEDLDWSYYKMLEAKDKLVTDIYRRENKKES